jgi:hypothetical protein
MTRFAEFLKDYHDYASLFSKQIYSSDIWSEQTGCELGEYSEYIECCYGKIYDFSTWFEHVSGQPYPDHAIWESYKLYKPDINSVSQ